MLRGFISTFASVIWPLAVAGILALLIKPLVDFVQQRTKLSKVLSILIVYALAIVISVAFAALVVPELVRQITALAQLVPKIAERQQSALENYAPDLIESVRQYFGQEDLSNIIATIWGSTQKVIGGSISLLGQATASLLAFAGFAAGLAIIPIYLFYLLETDRNFLRDLEHQLSFIDPRWRQDFVFLVREFVNILVAFFRGQIVIGLCLGVLLSIGLSAVGLNFGLVLGLLIGLLNIVPYLGTIIGVTVLTPIALFQDGGGWILFALVAAVFVAGQLINDYVLTPRIMGQTTGLHPMVIIISIFFWGVAFNGILGMVLAIPLTAFFVVFWRLVKLRYLPNYGELKFEEMTT